MAKLSSPWGKEFEKTWRFTTDMNVFNRGKPLALADIPSYGIGEEMEHLIRESEKLKLKYDIKGRVSRVTRRTNIEKRIILLDLELRKRGLLTEIERAGSYSKVTAREAPKKKGKCKAKKRRQASVFNGFV